MIDEDLWQSEGDCEIAAAPRRERRDAAAHRQRILAVARRLFAAAGVGAVSMHQIAREAGIGQGTLYRRYANKGALCRDLMYEHHVAFASDLRAWLAASAHLSPLTRLDEVLTRTLHFVNDSVALLEAIVATELRKDRCGVLESPPMPTGEQSWYQWLHEMVESLLTEAMARGDITPLDAPYTADMLLSLMNPLSLRFQQNEGGYALERIIAGVRHVFIQGIHAATTPASRCD